MDSHYSDMYDAAQPEPAPSKGTDKIIDLVVQDLERRAKVGKEKYGCYLYANNGREALLDAYQEALDLCMYLRQKIREDLKK